MSVDSTLVVIPAGHIELRDARLDSVRGVQLVPFRMGTTPVTGALWAEVMGEERSRHDVPVHPVTWLEAVAWCNAASARAGVSPAYTIDGDHVTWDVASDGFRLPTEAEWEWACRAGTTAPTYGALADIAWTADDDVVGPQGVGLKQPNSFGLYDTIGNVWEWCWDYADTARYADYRTLRGGGWADRSWSCRASVRRASAPDALLEDVGFRVARGAVGAPGSQAAQGWSAEADDLRASKTGPLPLGWTPLR